MVTKYKGLFQNPMHKIFLCQSRFDENCGESLAEIPEYAPRTIRPRGKQEYCCVPALAARHSQFHVKRRPAVSTRIRAGSCLYRATFP